MKTPAMRIQQKFETQTAQIGHCVIYEDELQSLWPLDEANRKAKIEQFAKEYRFKLRFYKHGLYAIFEEEAPLKALKASWGGDNPARTSVARAWVNRLYRFKKEPSHFTA